jgi:hypothetical protein
MCTLEANDLGRTDKGEVVRVEEQHDQIGIDLGKAQPSDAVADRARQIEGRRSVPRL